MSTSAIKGYQATIHWRNGQDEISFLTVEERDELIGHSGVFSAVYTPLVPVVDGVVAWYVENVSPGPFLTNDERAVMGYVEQGATAWGLGRMQ